MVAAPAQSSSINQRSGNLPTTTAGQVQAELAAIGALFDVTADGRWSDPGTGRGGTWKCQVNSLGQNENRLTADAGGGWIVVQISPDGTASSGMNDDRDRVQATRVAP